MNLRPHRYLWRGGLLPLGCEATPNPANRFIQKKSGCLFDDCFAAEREQAPSPQMFVCLSIRCRKNPNTDPAQPRCNI
ncbi:hypothetical protein EI534_23860 [Pseudomonas frederiksbergensis]|nr:hypothetical protein [Pseudomonas frederiksbergensis]